MTINTTDIKILWGKAAGRCSMPDCRKKLVEDASKVAPSKSVLFGENCHIVAESNNGPRGESSLSTEDRNRYPNLILLCANHHTIIDKNFHDWPVELLHQIKSDHEVWVETQLTEPKDDINLEIYSGLINKATDLLLLNAFDYISDHAISLMLYEEFVDGVDVFCEQVHRTIWPKTIPDLEVSIVNLCERLSKYISHFMDKAKLVEMKEQGKGFYKEDKRQKFKLGPHAKKYYEESNK